MLVFETDSFLKVSWFLLKSRCSSRCVKWVQREFQEIAPLTKSPW